MKRIFSRARRALKAVVAVIVGLLLELLARRSDRTLGGKGDRLVGGEVDGRVGGKGDETFDGNVDGVADGTPDRMSDGTDDRVSDRLSDGIAGLGGKKVLVIRVDPRVGNVLLTTPLVEALKEAWPDHDIAMLVAPSKAKIVEGLCRVVPFDKKALFRRPLRFLGSLWRLREERFDVAIDASHWHEFSVSSACLLAWTGAPIRIAHDRGLARRFANRLVAAPPSGSSEVDAKLALLAPLGIVRRGVSMKTLLGTRSPEALAVDAWVGRGVEEGHKLVGLWPGARKANHRAPAELFVRLGRISIAHGARPIVLWGPGEEDVARSVADGIEGALVAPATSLAELAAILRRCAALATNDTGPMHLAVACNTPTLAVFMNSEPSRWGHSRPPHVMISGDERPFEDVEGDAERALVAMLAVERP